MTREALPKNRLLLPHPLPAVQLDWEVDLGGTCQLLAGGKTIFWRGNTTEELCLVTTPQFVPQLQAVCQALKQAEDSQLIPTKRRGLRLVLLDNTQDFPRFFAQRQNSKNILYVLEIGNSSLNSSRMLPSPTPLPCWIEVFFELLRRELAEDQPSHEDNASQDDLEPTPSWQLELLNLSEPIPANKLALATDDSASLYLSTLATMLGRLLYYRNAELRRLVNTVSLQIVKNFSDKSRNLLRTYRDGKIPLELAADKLSFWMAQAHEQMLSFRIFSCFLVNQKKTDDELSAAYKLYAGKLELQRYSCLSPEELEAANWVGRLHAGWKMPDAATLAADSALAQCNKNFGDFRYLLNFCHGFRSLRFAIQASAFSQNRPPIFPSVTWQRQLRQELEDAGICQFRPRYELKAADLEATLKRLGLTRGQSVYLQANWETVHGLNNGKDTVLKTLQKILTKAGTLIVGEKLVLPDFRTIQCGERVFSVWGKAANSFRDTTSSPFDAESPLAKLETMPHGKILLISDYKNIDFDLILENELMTPCRRRGMETPCPITDHTPILNFLKRNQLIHDGFLGNAHLIAIECEKYRRVFLKFFKPSPCRKCPLAKISDN